MAEKFSPLGLITATRTEFFQISPLLAEAGFNQSAFGEKSGLGWVCGEIREKQILLLRSGVGKVSAAMATQFLIDHFQPRLVVNLGAAGALNSDLKPGSVIVTASAQEWDVDLSALYMRQFFTLPPEEALNLSAILSVLTSGVSTGKILTGDVFVADKNHRERLARKFSAIAVDMEAAAIAKVCAQNQTPFLIIKGISDQADNNAFLDLNQNLKLASANSFKTLKQILDRKLI